MQNTKTQTTPEQAEAAFEAEVVELKKAHGKIVELRDLQSDPPEFYAFRVPQRQDIQRMSQAIMKGGDPILAQERMAFECRLFPSKDELTQAIKSRPGLPLSLSEQLMKACGANAGFTTTVR